MALTTCDGDAASTSGLETERVTRGAAARLDAPPADAAPEPVAASETEADGPRTPIRGATLCAPPRLPLGVVCRRGALAWLRWHFVPRFPGCVLIWPSAFPLCLYRRWSARS